MPLRLPAKYKQVLNEKLTDDERSDIVSRYRRRRVLALVLGVSLTVVPSVMLTKHTLDGRLSSVHAVGATNKQDELQEQDDVIYSPGERVDDIATSDTAPRAQQSAPKVVESDNILLVGMDSRQGANGELGAGTAADVTGVRTDSIMFLHVPKSGGQPSVISFPRDLSVKRQDCNAWDGSSYNKKETVGEREDAKINSLYGAGGPRCLVRTVQSITGMKVNRFVSVDFSGFQGIVDALGGIDIDIDRPLIDGELGVIAENAGRFHMDGAQALNFVRARKIEGDLRGDYDRIERQQQFGMAVLAKMSSSSTFANPVKLNSLSSAVHDAISGENIDSGFILSVMSRAGEFQSNGVSQETIPTTDTNDNGNEVMDEDATEQMMKRIAVDA